MQFRTCTKCKVRQREDENHYYLRKRKNGTTSWSTVCRGCHRMATKLKNHKYKPPEPVILREPMARYATMPMRGVCWL